MGDVTAARRERDRRYYEANREAILERNRQYAQAHPEGTRERARRYRASNPDASKESQWRYRASLRTAVFDHYGWTCVCCGSTERPTIDHKNGNGRQHRTELFGHDRSSNTSALYRWLKNNGFPDDFQTLCLTCNTSKGNRSHCQINHHAWERLTVT